jgi:hypothetical protein
VDTGLTVEIRNDYENDTKMLNESTTETADE